MADAFFDKFIEDLVKGAAVNSRENGGPGVNILVSRENRGHEEKLAAAPGNVYTHYTTGASHAMARFKVAGLGGIIGGLAGSAFAPMAAKKGLGALAGGAMGKGVAGMAGKVMPHIGGGWGGAAFDGLTSIAGGALAGRAGQALDNPQQ